MAGKKTIFGTMKFSNGWRCGGQIELYGKTHSIQIKAAAYKAEEGMTPEQLQSFRDFYNGKADQLAKVEKALAKSGGQDQFKPTTLLFERDGDYALLVDDSQNPDEGLAVTIKPSVKVVSQDEYL